MRIFAIAVAMVLGWATAVEPEMLQLKTIPVAAKWIVHVDVDAARSSKVVRKVWLEWVPQSLRDDLEHTMAQDCGLHSWDDVHGVTLYGDGFAPHHGIVILRADLDEELLLRNAQAAPDHATQEHGSYTIHAWTSHMRPGQTMAGALYEPDVLVLASDVELARLALDTLAGQTQSLSGTTGPLAEPVPKGTIFLARAVKLAADGSDRSRWSLPIKQFRYAEGQQGDRWFGNLSAVAESENAAARVKSALEGMLALVWLCAEPAPELQQLLDQVKIKVDGKKLEADFQGSVEEITAQVPEMCRLWERFTKMRMPRGEVAQDAANASATEQP